MAVVTTPAQLAFVQRARFARVIHKQVEVHKLIAQFGREDFYSLTGGVVSTRQLRAMGHPFARGGNGAQRGIVKGSISAFRASTRQGYFQVGKNGRGGFKAGSAVKASGIVDRLPINRQTGRLQMGIKLDGPVGPKMIYSLYSDAPYAKRVLAERGTARMVPRGLLGPSGVIRKRHKARIQTLISMVRASQAA